MTKRRLACTCEDIDLHEVDRALSLGLRDLESIKRYTGLGTGICQGKQCLSFCALYLAEKTQQEVHPYRQRPLLHPVELGRLAQIDDRFDEQRRDDGDK